MRISSGSLRFLAIAIALGVTLAPHQPAGAQTASMDLLRRAVDPNPTLESYTASARLDATLHAILPVHKSYDGTVYYLKPKRKIEFENVRGALSRFKDLASSTPTYDEAVASYTITPLGNDGSVSTYSFVPKKSGSRVKSITLTVNDASALVSRAQWFYNNGGKLSFTQTYTNVGEFRLPIKTDIAARFPDYSVDGTISFANYKPNASVSPSVFAASPAP